VEIAAYSKGILRRWWLVGLLVVLSYWIGGLIGNAQTSEYTASTSILLNAKMLSQMAVPVKVVRIATPVSYEAQVVSRDIASHILNAYPRLNESALKKDIVVSTDAANQVLLISVTDISPESAADICRYLSQRFVQIQNAHLIQQIDYYESWLQQTINSLTADINKLIAKINNETPPPAQHGPQPTLDPMTQHTIDEDEFTLDHKQADLYNYQQALTDLQKTRRLFKDSSYVVAQPVTVSDVPVVSALSTGSIRLVALTVGILVAIILSILIDYFTPFIRHQGELKRIVGFSSVVTVPRLFGFERRRLLQFLPPLFNWRIASLRLFCASIAAPAAKDNGRIILLTSPHKKQSFSGLLALFLAYSGYRTLLIDAGVDKPGVAKQFKQVGPSNLMTGKGLLLSFIMQTKHSHLFVLPAGVMINQDQQLTASNLVTLLPELQEMFSIIIIDASPLDCADTHLLAPKAAETLLLIKKHRDSFKDLRASREICEQLHLNVECLLLS
jgi:capsular polysaccharide biosynthesis protein